MEIERKYLIDEKNLPADLESCRSVLIEQGYLCRKPVVRIRRQDDDYILTYKSGGLMAREEYNLPLGAEGYAHLKEKIDGKLISKRRYLIPMENGLTIELDVFYEPCKGLLLAEVSQTAGRRSAGSLVCHHDMQRRKEPYAGEHSRSRILDVGVGV